MKTPKAFVFDLDGTLFETSARVVPTATGHGRYVEFKDSQKLIEESKARHLVAFAQEVQDEGHSVYILTARGSIIAPAIKRLLASHGLTAKYVFTVGDRGFDIPSYKAEILAQLSKEYPTTYFFDDDEENLKMVPSNVRARKA